MSDELARHWTWSPGPTIIAVMRAIVLLLGAVLGLVAGEVAPFAMTNDPRFDAALSRLLAAQPGPQAYAEQDFDWLMAVATAADRDRHYDVAEAAMSVVTERWPWVGMAWGGLSCFQGKQGKFAEALHSVDEARKRPRPDRQQLDGISAVWLWQQGRHDDAQALLNAIPKPKDDDHDHQMWLVCQAFYHATCDHDMAATRSAMETLLALRDVGHWRYFLARDVAFDALRGEPWFIALLGETSKGPAAAQPFSAAHPSPAVDQIMKMPVPTEETLARAELAKGYAALKSGSWDEAVHSADRALALVELPEAYLIKAMGHAGQDDAVAAMDALRQISHQGFRLNSWTVDLFTLIPACRSAVKRLVDEAKSGAGSNRSVALALVIDCHFAYAWRDYDEVIKAMDAAEQWDPRLAEVPNTRAISKIDKSDWASAEADLATAIRLNPDYADAFFNRAYLRREQGTADDAFRAYTDARTHGFTYPGTDLHYALFLGHVGRLDEAEKIVTAELTKPRSHRSSPGICWELSSQYMEHRRYIDAERWTRQVIAMRPTWGEAWTKLCGDLSRQGRHAEALECARTHLDSDPDAFDGQLAVATELVYLGRRDEASAIVAKVPLPEKDERQGLYHACRASYAVALGDENMAREELTAASKDPNRRWFQRWIRCDIQLDGYRDRPWFSALSTETRP